MNKKFLYNNYFNNSNCLLIIYCNNILNSSIRYISVKGILGKFLFNMYNFNYFNFNFLCLYRFFFKKDFYIRLRTKYGADLDFFFKNKFKCNIKPLYLFFISSLFRCCYYLSVGLFDKLEITGYARRAWLSKNKIYIILKVGKSNLDKVFISKKVSLILIRKRLIYLYTYSIRYLKKISYNIFFCKPSDVYKGAGIILKSYNLVMKKRFIK